MTVTPACVAAVVDASNGRVSDAEAAELIRYMEAMRRAEEGRGNVDQLDARLMTLARERAEQSQIAAALAQKHAALSAVAYARSLDHVRGLVEAGLDRRKALLAMMEGTTRNVANGRASVAATALAYSTRYQQAWNLHLLRNPDAARLVAKGDKAFAEAVVREMREPGSTKDAAAAALARVYSDTAETIRADLVRMGAPIGRLEGWSPQAHAAERVVQVSANEWVDFILPRLDLDRSLPGLAPELRRETLRGIYQAIITGVERTPSAVEAGAKVGPANMANSLAQARVLHFADAAAWLSYAERFGAGTIHDAMASHIRNSAKSAALMERFGPNPEATLLRLRAELQRQAAEDTNLSPRDQQRQARALDPSNKDGTIGSAWAEANGLTASPVSINAAQVGTAIRAWMSMSKLAGAVVSSVSDLATRASALTYQGRSFSAAWADNFRELAAGRGTQQGRETAAMIDAGLDGIHGQISAAGISEDMPLGKWHKATAFFYKVQGMTWWTDAAKAGTARMLMRWMGDNAGGEFGSLRPEYRRVLRQHGIGPAQWELIRATAWQGEDGNTYVTPDRIASLPLARFAVLARPALEALDRGLADRIAARAAADAREAQWVASRVARFEGGLARNLDFWNSLQATADAALTARRARMRERMDEIDLRLSELAEFHQAIAEGRIPAEPIDLGNQPGGSQPDAGGAGPATDAPGPSRGFRPMRERYLERGDPATLAARQEGELRGRLDRLRRLLGEMTRDANARDDARVEAFWDRWEARRAELNDFIRQVEHRSALRENASRDERAAWTANAETHLADARRDLEITVRRFFADEMRFGLLETDAASRRLTLYGTRPGTPWGEAARFIMQFKGYPIAFTQRVLGRAVMGGGGEPGTAERMLGSQARHIGGLLAGLLVTGWIAMTLKDIIKGYGPRDPTKPDTIMAALVQSGGAGIYGDYLFAQASRFGNSPLESVAGPTASTAASLATMWTKVRSGEAKGGESLSLFLQNTPFINLWYTRPVLDMLILNSLREGLSPGFMARQDKRRLDDYGQQRWLPRSAWQ